MTGDRPREFLQLSDGSYVRVTSTDDGELMPAGNRLSRNLLAADQRPPR